MKLFSKYISNAKIMCYFLFGLGIMFLPNLVLPNSALLSTKIIFVLVVALVLWALFELYSIFYEDYFTWWKSILSGFFSIVILIIIGGLMTQMDQGKVIPIDMYFGPWYKISYNIIVFHFFLYFLSILCSFYPTYIRSSLFGPTGTEYIISSGGIITYKEPDIKDSNEQKVKVKNKHLSKLIGLLLYFIWTIILLYSALDTEAYSELSVTQKFNDSSNIYKHLFLVTALFFIVRYHFVLSNKKFEVRKIKNAKGYANTLLISIVVNLLVLIFVAMYFQWSLITLFCQYHLIGLLAIYYLFVRSYRSEIYKNDNTHIKETGERNRQNAEGYIKILRLFGLITLMILLGINVNSKFANFTNVLNILLGSLIALYTLIILIVKYLLFINNNNEVKDFNPLRRFLFFDKKSKSLNLNISLRVFTPTILMVVIILMVLNIQVGNNLHTLHPSQNLIGEERNIDDFVASFNQYKVDSLEANYFYAAYGGGLMANAWNLRLLNHLKTNEKKVYHNIVAMSGVSGGGMGLAINALSDYGKGDKESIQSIKNSNILGLEMSWFFGKDLIRKLIPLRNFRTDRTKRSLLWYSKLMGFTDKELTYTFYDWYHNFASQNNDFYPNLIFNTTGSFGNYGVASAVNASNVFPSAVDILSMPDVSTSLNYLEAVSTCSRFPIISPPAKIEGKGYFSDGGIYENSGLLSLLSFRRSLFSSSMYKEHTKAVVISVTNSKQKFIKSILEKANLDFKSQELIHLNDFAALGAAAINTERLPNYIRARELQDTSINYHTIDLPFYIMPHDIKAYFNGKLSKEDEDQVMALIDESNDELLKILGDDGNDYNLDLWGIVSPPTARILSDPVVKYIDLMVEHPFVLKQISNIKGE